MPRQTLIFLTPCFCGGAYNKTGPAELRVPSLRGQLRYWTRVLFHVPGKPDEGARKEHQLFGGIRAKELGFKHPISGQKAPDALASRFTLQLAFRPPLPVQTSQALCPHDTVSGPHQRGKGWQQAIPEGVEFDLEWSAADRPSTDINSDFLRVLKSWVLLGSLGLRANRASGSVWRYDWQPSVADFLKELEELHLPCHIVVKVLRPLQPQEIAAWRPPVRTAVHQWQQLQTNPTELLRAVATDTLVLPHNHGDALGHGGAGSRKASPLKFKVGHFKEGYRLIAISDRRDGRDGDLANAIRALAQAMKPIGLLLRDAKIV